MHFKVRCQENPENTSLAMGLQTFRFFSSFSCHLAKGRLLGYSRSIFLKSKFLLKCRPILRKKKKGKSFYIHSLSALGKWDQPGICPSKFRKETELIVKVHVINKFKKKKKFLYTLYSFHVAVSNCLHLELS